MFPSECEGLSVLHGSAPTHQLTHSRLRCYAVANDATCTRASLKHAPPPMSVSASETSAVAVAPLRVLRRHNPLGRLTVPRARIGVTVSVQCTSPRSLKTRT